MFGRSRARVATVAFNRGGSGIWTFMFLAIVGLSVFMMTNLGNVSISDVLVDMWRTAKSFFS